MLSLAYPRAPFHHVFTHGAAVLLAVIYLLSFQRPPYHVGWGDTGNRMMLSAVPLLFFFLLVAYGRITLGRYDPNAMGDRPAGRGLP